jgi:hypothetical protein
MPYLAVLRHAPPQHAEPSDVEIKSNLYFFFNYPFQTSERQSGGIMPSAIAFAVMPR